MNDNTDIVKIALYYVVLSVSWLAFWITINSLCLKIPLYTGSVNLDPTNTTVVTIPDNGWTSDVVVENSDDLSKIFLSYIQS